MDTCLGLELLLCPGNALLAVLTDGLKCRLQREVRNAAEPERGTEVLCNTRSLSFTAFYPNHHPRRRSSSEVLRLASVTDRWSKEELPAVLIALL